jgi:hypothetical protein
MVRRRIACVKCGEDAIPVVLFACSHFYLVISRLDRADEMLLVWES